MCIRDRFCHEPRRPPRASTSRTRCIRAVSLTGGARDGGRTASPCRQLQDVVGQGVGQALVMGGDDESLAGFGSGRKDVGEDGALVRVEALLGFVEDQHPGGSLQEQREME